MTGPSNLFSCLVRWGDYTATSLDPNNGLTFCTVQEYAETDPIDDTLWGTWIATIALP